MWLPAVVPKSASRKMPYYGALLAPRSPRSVPPASCGFILAQTLREWEGLLHNRESQARQLWSLTSSCVRARLESKLGDSIQSRIQSEVKHRGGSARQKRVCGRSQQNQGSQGTYRRSEQG